MKFVKPDPVKCVGSRACEKACAKTFFKREEADYSSIRVKEALGKHEINVCNQCGVCIAVCPVKALNRNKAGAVMVNKDLCVGCFMCVGYCPTLSMRRAPGACVPFKCVACGVCVKACKSMAISMAEADHANLTS